MLRGALAVLMPALAAVPLALAVEPPDAWFRAAAYADHEAVPRGGNLRVAVVLDLDRGYHVNANPPSLDFQIPTVVVPEPHAAVRWGEVTYPAGEPLAASWAPGTSVRVYGGRTVLLVGATVADDAPTGETTLRLTVRYQGCDADTCYQPGSGRVEAAVRVVEAGAAPVAAHADVFAPAAASPAPDGPSADLRFEGEVDLAAAFEHGLGVYLGVLFLGGLLLNLTPCVFPLIPVTMTVFAQQGESRPAKVLPLAVLYVLGLAATFTVVGVAAALAGRGMGVVLQEPAGVLGVVVVLAAMMASTFGAFEIRLPSGLMGRLGARRGALGAVLMGMVMGAIAAPCVGPLLVALITFVATTRRVGLGAVSFFVTGLGLGLPYVFLGLFTGLVNRFPRGGGWLVWTKRLMGLALAGLILYYVEPFIDAAFFRPLVLALFLFAALYLGVLEGRDRRPFTRRFLAVRLGTAAALVAAGAYVYASATAEKPAVAWTPWTEGALEAARADGRPVLLYFGADWCVECKAWKARVFTDAEVVRESAAFARVYVDVTRLEEGPRKEFAKRYQAVNPPVVAVLDAAGRAVAAYRDPPPASRLAAAMRQAAAP